jgi:hypothetical protein
VYLTAELSRSKTVSTNALDTRCFQSEDWYRYVLHAPRLVMQGIQENIWDCTQVCDVTVLIHVYDCFRTLTYGQQLIIR